MAINFPDSPTNGETHVVGSLTWQFNGEKWLAASNTSLDMLSDVTAPTPSSGEFLKWNGTAWVDDAIDLGTDTTGSYVTSLVAGTGVTLSGNSGEGATPTVTVDTSVIQARVANVTDTEIGYLDGVTSPIQTQIDAKQAILVSATTTTVSVNTATTIESFALSAADSAEFTVKVKQGSRYESLKALALHNGTTVDLAQYGELSIAATELVAGSGAVTWVTRTSNFGNRNIFSVAYGNNIWVAGGQYGQLRTSTDGTTWTTRTSNFGNTRINSVAYGNSLWVAGGNSSQLRTSTDAVTWTTRESNFGNVRINSIVYGNNLWVAAGNNGQLRTSTDATTWTTRTSNFDYGSIIWSVAYANSLWVAGGYNGQLRTSTDAITWTTRTSNFATAAINSVAYGNNLWVAGGGSYAPSAQLCTSTDAITWVTQTSNFGNTRIFSVAYGNSLWVAGGETDQLRTSTDAITWTTRTSNFTGGAYGRISSIVYANNLWVAGGYYGQLRTSATDTATVGIPLTLSADISGSDVRLRATITDAATTNAEVKVLKTVL